MTDEQKLAALQAEKLALEQQRNELQKTLQEICDLQAESYGYGAKFHLGMIDVCENARAVLAKIHGIEE